MYAEEHLKAEIDLENLQIKLRKWIIRKTPEPFAVPEAIDQCLSMGFVRDQLSDGRSYRLFNVIDGFNREALATDIDLSLPSERDVRGLNQIIEWYGKLLAIRSVNGRGYLGGTFLLFDGIITFFLVSMTNRHLRKFGYMCEMFLPVSVVWRHR